ncbi:MAG: FAD-binding oxidoreductase [Acidobacteriota bacterium]
MAEGSIVVIGAGFAGAATAWWLRRAGADRVLVLEREPVPGAHASGKNAGIARQPVLHPSTALLAARGAAFLRRPPDGFCEGSLFEATGGYLATADPEDRRLDLLQKAALAAGVYTYEAERSEVVGRLPLLDGAPFVRALASPTDGMVDIHLLLTSYLQGVPLRTGTQVEGFRRKGSRITALETSRGVLEVAAVVNAAGAWAADVAALAGAAPVRIEPRRRHLLHTGPLPDLSAGMPYAWLYDPEVYFRTESGGLLLSPCDEEIQLPGSPPTHPDASLWLARRLKTAAPRMVGLPVARAWAELRCFSPDGAFVVGRDPHVANFYWACGLAGHGMTASSAVGELAASLILGSDPPLDPAPYDPGRFTAG